MYSKHIHIHAFPYFIYWFFEKHVIDLFTTLTRKLNKSNAASQYNTSLVIDLAICWLLVKQGNRSWMHMAGHCQAEWRGGQGGRAGPPPHSPHVVAG